MIDNRSKSGPTGLPPQMPEISADRKVIDIRELAACVSPVDDVDVIQTWTFPLVASSDALHWMQSTLDDHERQRAERFFFDRHRHRFIVAHAVLRQVIGGLIGRAPVSLQWKYEPLGKPSLISKHNPTELEFNLSHSGDCGFVAAALRRPVGADVEGVRELKDAKALARIHFSEAEFSRLNDASMPGEFFRYWTRKEALLKATGKGLSGGLRNFCTAGLAQQAYGQVVACTDAVRLTSAWSYYDCPAPDDYLAAIVTDFHPKKITCHSLVYKT